LVTALEGLALVGAGIAVAEAGAILLVRLAPIGRMLGSLKALAKIALVLVEIAAVRLISNFLRVAEADPHHVNPCDSSV
jgi:uncharacterized membrane protein YuzA (DUF378 family)